MLDSFKKFAISKLNVVVVLPDELVTAVFSDDELADVGAVIFIIVSFFIFLLLLSGSLSTSLRFNH